MVDGRKDDTDKIRYSLLPWESVREIVKVLEFGAKKYAENNWQRVPNAKTRYFDAMMRHVLAYRFGERNDPETGLPHLAHAGCCLLFALWFDLQPAEPQIPEGMLQVHGNAPPFGPLDSQDWTGERF